MMLRYSDSDEVTDKEMRQLNLQDAAHTYMMEQDAPKFCYSSSISGP